MMLKLFLTFLKINFLTTSGPASIGLTKQLVVPSLVSEDRFSQMIALASGIPGSDAIQMAWQVGFDVRGIAGALVSILGALIPSIFLLSVVFYGMGFIKPDLLAKFFAGVNPALAIMLVVTAFSLVKSGQPHYFLWLLIVMMFVFKIPLPLLLVGSGVMGVILL